jgi:DtxR family Mn-dependent transcriptional regulator
MNKAKPLSESMENYLEVIWKLEKTQKVARAKDVAEGLGIQPGSVTGALKTLVEKELINYAPYSFITLTERGRKIAQDITRRHRVLEHFLHDVLQLDSTTADSTACRMEHAIDSKTLERLMLFVQYIQKCPRTGADWVDGFAHYVRSEKLDANRCRRCLATCQQSQKGIT